MDRQITDELDLNSIGRIGANSRKFFRRENKIRGNKIEPKLIVNKFITPQLLNQSANKFHLWAAMII